MLKMMFLMLAATTFVASTVYAQDWDDDDADDAPAAAVVEAADDTADDLEAEAKAEAVEEAVADVEPALETAVDEEAVADAGEKKESSSWFRWFWPFSSAKAEPAKVDGEEAEPVVEEVAIVVDEEVAEPVEPVVEEPDAVAPEREKQTAGTTVGRFMIFYIPNIVLNFTDIVSMGVGVGAKTSVNARVTRYCQIGGDYGDMFFVEKGFDRRIGGGYDDGYNFQLGPIRAEERYIDKNFGRVRDIVITGNESVIASPKEEVYIEKCRDFWSVGVELGWLIVGRVDVHLVEIADFVVSVFGLDLTGDNLK
ncbi:MAG: hypothetical protein JW808_08935 [Victivallales bacterium]|nr:hypothetical protein [Victivallales bacterium]